MSGRLEDKVAIITGAGQGIGRAYAERFSAEGARVVVAEFREETGKAVAEQIGGHFVQVDVSDEESATALAAATLKLHGRIDVLINNAGIFYDLDQRDQSLAYLKRIIEVNMLGPWICARAVFPAMKEQRSGKIINQSSGASWMYSMSGYVMNDRSTELASFNYSVSKAGVNAFTHHMASALGQFGISVNAIAPGVTMTDATRKHVPEQMMGMIKMMSALRRTLEPEEIASVAVFLASDESNGITGQVIPVDAGVAMLG
ncbi:MAG: SDR family NAD(P)-dependent oxidoreductase [Actinomycetota bacterium]